jgi:vacuolar-type H+-ATPase catalytic subunit A/Vma1
LSDAVAGISSLSVSANSRPAPENPLTSVSIHMSLHFLGLFSKLLKKMVSASIQFDQISYNRYINMVTDVVDAYSSKTFGSSRQSQAVIDHKKDLLDLFVAVLAQENHPLWISFDHTLKELIKNKIDDAIREAWTNDRISDASQECVTTANYCEDESTDSSNRPPIPTSEPTEIDWEQSKEEQQF